RKMADCNELLKIIGFFHWLSPYLKAGAKRELRDRHQIAFQGRQGGVSTAKHGDGSLPFYIEVREIYRSQVGTAVQHRAGFAGNQNTCCQVPNTAPAVNGGEGARREVSQVGHKASQDSVLGRDGQAKPPVEAGGGRHRAEVVVFADRGAVDGL